VLSKCGWSPFSGYRFKHRIAGTWVNGHQRYDGQQVLDGPYGQALAYQR
jgi:dihydroorotase